MAEQIIDGNGSGYYLAINPDGSLNVNASGISIEIGSLALTLEDVYVRSGANLTGSFYLLNPSPTLASNNYAYKFEYAYSGTSTGIIGSEIGSITKFLGLGSFVQVLSYSNNVLINVGSWT